MKKGFTLIELLIVIAILAILATTVVVVLNPAQILAQARDAQRISDLSSVKSAIALYLATATGTPVVSATSTCTITGCNNPGPFTTAPTVNVSTAVTGTGWVGVDLRGTSGGSSLSALPTDPTNSLVYYYGYKGSATALTFKLAGRLESAKYGPMMGDPAGIGSDGGIRQTCPQYPPVVADTSCYYEIGTDVAL